MKTVPKNYALYDELSHFFEEYARSFDAQEWPQFVSHYHEPAMSVRGDGTVALVANHAQAQQFFRQVADKWREEGYSHFRTRDLEIREMGQHCALVTFVWEMCRHDQSMIREWKQSYEVVRDSNGWGVVMSTFHSK